VYVCLCEHLWWNVSITLSTFFCAPLSHTLFRPISVVLIFSLWLILWYLFYFIQVQKLMTEYTFYAQRNQHLFQSWSADLSLGKSRVLAQVLREEAANSSRGFGFDDDARNEDVEDDANQTVASKNVVFEDWLQTVRNSQTMA